MTVEPTFAIRRGALFAAFRKIGENNLSLIAAGVAFYSMLSIFPALAAMIALLSLVADPEVVVIQLEEMRELMPDDVYEILNAQIVGLVNTSSDTLGWTGIVSIMVALWSARAGVGAMIHGLNAVFDREGRATLRHYLRALMLTFTLVGVGVVALLMVVIAPVVLSFFALGAFSTVVIDLLRWTIAIAVIFIGIGLLYRYGPNRRPKKTRILTVGSVFAAVSWAGLSIAFSYYVANFGNYNEVYGSIGAVIAMLMWLWISSFLVLLGASLNAETEARMTALAVATEHPEENAPASLETDALASEKTLLTPEN
ncbi:MAG: YihY/virulence factor BrkB family protein [Roseobacter sp.]